MQKPKLGYIPVHYARMGSFLSLAQPLEQISKTILPSKFLQSNCMLVSYFCCKNDTTSINSLQYAHTIGNTLVNIQAKHMLGAHLWFLTVINVLAPMICTKEPIQYF